MNLFETLKNTFLKQPKELVVRPELPLDKIRQDFSAEDAFYNNYAWFDGFNGMSYVDNVQRTAEQATKIDIYRNTAKIDTVSVALDTLVNEVIYSEDFKTPVILNCDLDNKKLEDAIQKAFDKILKLLNLNRNFFRFVRDSYIDGQMNVLLDYKDDTKGGIKGILFLDPKYLTLDIEKGTYKYVDFLANNSRFLNRYFDPRTEGVIKEYNIEEIVHGDFGIISDDGLILSELEKAIKTANQLKTLEDLLIPLRFSRSVSRRVFNVDVSDLPNSKAESFLRKMANTFKYRKEYNTQTGEIKNQQHMTSMVEDYWAASRGGQKGISVDVLNETGDLGQLDDLNYYRKKLYQALGVPQNRILDQEDGNASIFDLQSDQVTNEDMQFFQKIRRIRLVYSEFIKAILKRELVATRVFKEKDYDEIKGQIDIVFPSENQFLERMSVTLFMKKVDAFNSARDLGGKVLPVKLLYKTLFGYTDDEVDDLLKEIEKESKDPLLKTFYQSEDDFGSGSDDSSDSGFGGPKKPEPKEPDDSEDDIEITKEPEDDDDDSEDSEPTGKPQKSKE